VTHHVLDRWTGIPSALARADARVKLAALVVLLVGVALLPHHRLVPLALPALVVALGVILARLPVVAFARRVAVVLPFAVPFALLTWLAGDPVRAVSLLLRACVSAAAVLLIVATTPWPRLMGALNWFRVPRLLLISVQFLYRYLFVIGDQAERMKLAALSRGGRRSGFTASAGTIAVLFAQSYERAEHLHRSMLSRGFTGGFAFARPAGVAGLDFVILACALTVSAALFLWQ
jgi:cobalt/nickel transport system permease protein